jgi:hypothetical protein
MRLLRALRSQRRPSPRAVGIPAGGTASFAPQARLRTLHFAAQDDKLAGCLRQAGQGTGRGLAGMTNQPKRVDRAVPSGYICY